ncbi:MAG: hypothetical protein BJ554DRAFT_5950 [Olpidium bornovanus]|uniref:Uncharacterized protein n=1 Tax=Olpidium bornovanus TaxID=278681 RepID=A0A8H7ZYC9_9FUNG|nr:MAG: hypothetical protein BJ554DRAFT_5950 [Olpidium bornovanus]
MGGHPRKLRKVPTSSMDLFYLEDEELDFDAILSAPLPAIPLDVTWTAHWLAVEGVQPAIPQNPAIVADGTVAC